MGDLLLGSLNNLENKLVELSQMESKASLFTRPTRPGFSLHDRQISHDLSSRFHITGEFYVSIFYIKALT